MNNKSSAWFKFYPKDWLAGTRDLSVEARGVYIDCICLIMAYDEPLSHDDNWFAHQLHISVRKWKTLKPLLVAAQKLLETNSGLDNERCREERLARHDMRTRNKKIAAEREHKKRESASAQARLGVESASTQARLDVESATLNGFKNGEIPEKPNDINKTTPRVVAREQHDSRDRDRVREKEEEKKKENGEKKKEICTTKHVQQAARMWNDFASEVALPLIKKLTQTRAKHIKARLNDYDGLETWRRALDMIPKSSFLCGEGGRDTWRGADIDFVIRPDHFAKLLEGGYGTDRLDKKSSDLREIEAIVGGKL